jgi:hypothetical protein
MPRVLPLTYRDPMSRYDQAFEPESVQPGPGLARGPKHPGRAEASFRHACWMDLSSLAFKRIGSPAPPVRYRQVGRNRDFRDDQSDGCPHLLYKSRCPYVGQPPSGRVCQRCYCKDNGENGENEKIRKRVIFVGLLEEGNWKGRVIYICHD